MTLSASIGAEYPVEAVRNALAGLEQAYWGLVAENERLREMIAQTDAEWIAPVEVERLREALAEIHDLYGGKRAGLIAWTALCCGSAD